MLRTKLAGTYMPLQEAVARTIEEARERMKLAASEKDEKEKTKKLVAYEKKEHGHIPSAKEEEEEHKEKCSSIINPSDPEEVEKLAQALDFVSEKFAADGVNLGKEAPQGGTVLPVASAVGGSQPYKKDSSKKHNVPMNPGSEKPSDAQGSPANAVATDERHTPGGKGVKMPPNILRKMGGVTTLKAEVEKIAAIPPERLERARKAGQWSWHNRGKLTAAGGAGAGFAVGRMSKKGKEKESEAVEYILGKIAEGAHLGGEHPQGGQTLSNTAPVPSNPGRQLISGNKAPAAANKREAKAPRKKELAEVLTEPAFSAAHDSKVNENLGKANAGKVSKIAQDLRSATKGGVETAAARALLMKISEEGCQCEGKGSCRHCKMRAAMKKKQSAVTALPAA